MIIMIDSDDYIDSWQWINYINPLFEICCILDNTIFINLLNHIRNIITNFQNIINF